MKKIFTFLLSLIFVSHLSAQSRLDYDNDSRWFWGLNVGATWSTADVDYEPNVGWGIVLGKSYNYQEGRLVSFDLRGRFLTGQWEGLNSSSSLTNVDGIAAYDNVFMDTARLNHLTRSTSLDLELVLHANRLRARTGWDVFVFGGIGGTAYKSRGDLTDAFGLAYDYNLTTVFSDESFESNLSDDGYKIGFMPSLGFGIGHQIGKRASFGIEHKTTFTRVDDFDGFNDPTSARKNDLFHYTSAYLRFQVRAYRPDYVDNTVDNTNPNPNGIGGQNTPPIVDFTAPANSGTTVNSAQYFIRGRVQFVNSSTNVTFRQNGNHITNFQYNPSNQQFSATVTLLPGQNVFELTGTNNFGTDQEQTIINFQEERTPPVVTYINPAQNPTTVQVASYQVVAQITNVTQQSQINMTLNGAPIVGFNFNASTGQVSSTINLNVGSNVITTTGTNTFGTDAETTTIIYNPIQIVQPPVVYFVDPNVNPTTVSTQNYTINADVLNVAGQQNIVFKQNGVVNNNFTYNVNTHRLTSTVVLLPGQNVFEVIGTNQAGSAQASTVIIYNRAAPMPPVVTITNPSVNPYETANQTHNLNATVLNVTTANQVVITLNGQTINNFTFNATNGGANVLLSLIAGSNVVTVKGTNADGTDQKQTVIIYRPVAAVQPPVVQFITPSSDPYTSSVQSYISTISVLNVANAAAISVIVNGQNATNFSFANSVVSLPLNLIDGANTITVTGTNTAGTASDVQTIIFQRPNIQVPPTVSFIDPSTNPLNVFTSTYHVVTRVRFVSAANQIVLKINGVATSNFNYVPLTELMEFNTVLVQGANTIEVIATNSAGTDNAITTIIYRELTPITPPVVTITTPAINPLLQTANTANIVATVLNVDNAANIQVTLNGVVNTSFNYNTTSKVLTFTANGLVLGNNTVQITGTNTAGQASASTVIIVQRQIIVSPPVVTIINPAAANSNTTVQDLAFKATVLNVSTQNQIVVTQNGQGLSASLWSFNPTTHEVILNTSLVVGNNVFSVTGTNTGGTDTKTCNVNFSLPVVVCDKPVINFTVPVSAGLTSTSSLYSVKATVSGVSSPNYIKLFLNGQLQGAGSYVSASSLFTKDVVLSIGMNAIEIEATNNCGSTRVNTTILYAPVAPPCLTPVVTRLLPITQNVNITGALDNIQASVVNATQAQISMTLNGASIPFTYDAVTHIVSRPVQLLSGMNSIKVIATTDCGTSVVEWNIKSTPCERPTLTLNSATAANNSSVVVGGIVIEIGVTGITNQSQLQVLKNNQAIGFVYNVSSGILLIDASLEVGMNTFAIAATNECGIAKLSHSVTRNSLPRVFPPTVSITNPASNPYSISQNGMTVEGVTTNITSETQLSITLNGASVNALFNSSNGEFSFNANFNQGANVVNATVVNSVGTAIDTKTVIYTVPVVVVSPPVIQLINPANCPAAYPRGVQTISGTVTNVTDPNQVVILFDNSQIPFTSSVVNNLLTFSFSLNVSMQTMNIPLVINATNAGGSDSETCVISILISASSGSSEGNGESVPPVDGALDPSRNNGGGTPVNGGRVGGTPAKPVTKPVVKPIAKPIVKPQPLDPIKPSGDSTKVQPIIKGGGK